MTYRIIIDNTKLMKLKCDLVNILLVISNGRTTTPIEKAKDHQHGDSYGHSNAKAILLLRVDRIIAI